MIENYEACNSLEPESSHQSINADDLIGQHFQTIQRGILLLKNNFDLFKRLLSFHLRVLQIDSLKSNSNIQQPK